MELKDIVEMQRSMKETQTGGFLIDPRAWRTLALAAFDQFEPERPRWWQFWRRASYRRALADFEALPTPTFAEVQQRQRGVPAELSVHDA